MDEMKPYGIDLCGENGEYHTVVVDGPLFQSKVALITGETVYLEYVMAKDFTLKER